MITPRTNLTYSPQPRTGTFVFSPATSLLFNDTDPATAAALAADHLPHSMRAFTTPVSQPLWTDPAFEGRRVMLKTTLDATFPPAAQEEFAEGSGVGWDVRDVEGGHEVFLTKPRDVANVVVDVVKGWR